MGHQISGKFTLWTLALVSVSLGLSGCVLIPTPTPTEPAPRPAFACEQALTLDEVSTNRFLLEGQVILTGSQGSIASALSSLEADGIRLRLVETCSLAYLDEVLEPRDQEFGFPPEREADPATRPTVRLPFHDPGNGEPVNRDADPLMMNLYLYDGESLGLPELLRRLTALSEELRVFADPNYMTGHLAKSPCSNPFGLEGSPFGLEGSPFGLEGSPDGGLGTPASPDAFWPQWAFETIGVSALRAGDVEASAEGVLVGVFDTSPYEAPGNHRFTGIDPPLTLQVEHPFPLPPLKLSADLNGPTPDIRDHGVFVAGLVHGVAWDSQKQLYRVLSADGCGDLYSLNKAVHQFISSNRDQHGLLRDTVMNFSLGVTKPRQMDLIDLEGIEDEIESLETALFEAFRRGAVIVAAAGNDSVNGTLRLPPELPAAYPFVLGVAGSTMQNGPSCFSNTGDLIAPAAEGTVGVRVCTPLAQTCPSVADPDGNCEWGLTSLATTSSSGYAYWVGTSFASPLVTGLSALAYNTGGSQIAVFSIVWSGLQPFGDPAFGAGLINIPDSFSP